MVMRNINRICGFVPVALSLAAFGLVMVAVRTGWGQVAGDEGAAAHIFQLLIVAEVPFVLVFAATADWTKLGRSAGLLAVQAAGLVLAFAPVAYFKL